LRQLAVEVEVELDVQAEGRQAEAGTVFFLLSQLGKRRFSGGSRDCAPHLTAPRIPPPHVELSHLLPGPALAMSGECVLVRQRRPCGDPGIRRPAKGEGEVRPLPKVWICGAREQPLQTESTPGG